MPLYEYQCDACGHRFERIQKFSDPPVDACPSCGGSVRKLISSPAIQFKGSGFYITDYVKSGKDAPAEGAAAKAPGTTDKPAEKSPAEKPAAATESKPAAPPKPAAKTGAD